MNRFSIAAWRRAGAACALMASVLCASAAQAATYTWNVASGSWTAPASWTPARTTPAATDELVFDGASIPVATASDVPTETVARLSVVNGASASWSATGGVTLTIGGGAGTDLDVAAGTQLGLTGAQPITLALSAGATGAVAGTMSSGGGAHRVMPTDAGSLVFAGGSSFRTLAGHTGSVFGTSGTNGVVVFQSGSSYRHLAGANPFGSAQPASRVVFQPGSLFRQESNVGLSLAGRTYGHLEFDMGAATLSLGGAAATGTTVENDLIVTTGTVAVNTTSGIFQMTVRGNVAVQPGATLSFATTSPGTSLLALSGSGAQTLSAAGTLTLNALSQLRVANSLGVTLLTNVTSGGTVTLVTGNLRTGSNLLRLTAGAAIVEGSNWVEGRLARDFSTGPNVLRAFPVGDASGKSAVSIRLFTVSAVGTLVASSAAGDHPQAGAGNIATARSVNRWWTANRDGFAGPTFATAEVSLEYSASDVDPAATPADFVVAKRDAPNWTFPAHTVGTTTAITATGLTPAQLTTTTEWAVGELLASDDIFPLAAGCISTATPCVAVPVMWDRDATTPVRAYSVTLELSPNLSLCGVQFASAGYLAPGTSGTPFFGVIALGGNRWTIDESTLGLPCGATGDGTLFTVHVTSSDPGGTGTISVISTLARDCANAAVPANPGNPTTIAIDNTPPTAVVLSATQRKTGNAQPPFGTTDVLVSWTGQEAGSSVQVWRKGFGGYPQYDENGGAVPAAPATPAAALGAGWTLTGITTSGAADRTATRDFQYYVAFATDGCGNVSASNRTNGTLNYHLGDVHDGLADCSGNDLVNTSDISFLGAHYGNNVPVNGAFECIDVGPTSDLSVDGRPTTDNVIQFEDLIIFALNHGTVSAPQAQAAPAAAPLDVLTLDAAATAGATLAVPLRFEGSGEIHGLSVQLEFDREVVEFLGVEPGRLLGAQGRPAVALSSGPGNVDVAVLGAGDGLLGRGEVAVARFRLRSAGDPRIVIARAIGRDAANRELSLGGGRPAAPVAALLPAQTTLQAARPSPFRDRTVLECALARDGEFKLAIYGLDGRRIRTLGSGVQSAGVHRYTWDGRDDQGREVAAGMYFARLIADARSHSRTIVKLK